MNSQPVTVSHSNNGPSKLSTYQSEAESRRSESTPSMNTVICFNDQTTSNCDSGSSQRRAGETSLKLSLFEAESPIIVRKRTPVRAVFDDLTTAHSLITSGSARSSSYFKYKKDPPEDQESKDSIALQNLHTRDYQGESSILSLPDFPTQAHLSNSNRNNDIEGCFTPSRGIIASKRSATLEVPIQPTNADSQVSVFREITDTFASSSTPNLTDRPFIVHAISHAKEGSNEAIEDISQRESLFVGKCIPKYQSITAVLPGHHKADNLAAHQFSVEDSLENSLQQESQNGQSYQNDVDDCDVHLCTNPGVLHPHSSNDDGPPSLIQLGPEQSPICRHQSSSVLIEVPNSPVLSGEVAAGDICKDSMYSGQDDDSSEGDVSDLFPLERYPISRGGLNQRSPNHDFLRSPTQSHLEIHEHHQEGNWQMGTNASPPKFALPSQPNTDLPIKHPALTMSHGLNHSSSYEDTSNLLHLAETPNSAPVSLASNRALGRYNPLDDDMGSRIKQPPQAWKGGLKSNNPFRSYINATASREFEDAYDEQLGDRANSKRVLSLEREVSMALRRASGYNAYDNQSNLSLPLEQEQILPAIVAANEGMKRCVRRNVEYTPPSDMGKGPHRQIEAFYDQQAISSKWVANQQPNIVRVPIHHHGSLPNSPPRSPRNNEDAKSQQNHPNEADDQNDWETVSESMLGKQCYYGFIGGSFRRTGSSIANTSDDGTGSSPVLEFGPYSSTDKIAQNPSNIQYSSDYRQKDLNGTCTPVFRPVSREYKVNGYLADSRRVRPHQDGYYRDPTPLGRSHTNPFKSPPDVRLGVDAERDRYTSYASPVAQECDITDQRPQHMGEETYSLSRPSQDSVRTDDIGEPGPMITHKQNWVLGAAVGGNQPTSQRIMVNDTHIQERYFNDIAQLEGQNHNAATLRKHDLKILEWQKRNENDGFAEVQTYGGRENLNQPRDRKPLVKGPPGAFYQGLRAVSDQKRSSYGYERDRPASGNARDLPTNSLRPLSLLTDRRPWTPVDKIIPDQSTYIGDGFVYRSPLAPPKRNSWQQLYSQSEMRRIRDAAKADGVFNSQIQLSARPAESREISGSRKQLLGPPRLAILSRYPSVQTHLKRKKKNISLTVLCLCAVFPPMLILYDSGALDGVMSWWTKGQCSGFGLKYKRLARTLMYAWMLAIVAGLAVFLAVWYVKLHPHGAGA